MTKRIKIIWVVIIYLALGLVIYGNVINGEFFLDDTTTVVTNAYIKDFSHIKDIFTQNSISGAGFNLEWYRPILILSYAVDYQFWGLNPVGYHLINIFFHVFSAVLLFFIVLKLFNKIRPAFIAGLIFIIHPIQTEAVSYISGRADLLLVFFLLISFLSFIYFVDSGNKNKPKYLLISLISFILALLSKETAVIYPGILILYVFTLGRINNKERSLKSIILPLVPFVGLAVIYQTLRLTVLNFGNSFSSFGQAFIQHTLMFLKTLPLYWQKLIWPINLHYHYETALPINYLDFQIIISVFIIFVMMLLIWKLKSYRKLFIFCFGWFFISLAPVSGILIKINFIIAERWMYLSAIGLFIIAGLFIDKILTQFNKNRIIKISLITLLVCYGLFFIVVGIKRNFIWRDAFAFTQDSLIYSPKESRLHDLLGSEYFDQKNFKEALKEYKIAVSLDPKNLLFTYNLGIYYAINDFDEETINDFDEVIKISPSVGFIFDGLAGNYASNKEYHKASKLVEKMLEIVPGTAKTFNALGVYYAYDHQKDKAIVAFEKALSLNPNDQQITANLEKVKMMPSYGNSSTVP